jgi:cell division protein FtsB
MRLLGLALLVLVVSLQWPLWFGKGGWLRVWELDRQIVRLQQANDNARARNAALDADVRDLKQGYDAIEERARSELGMIREDEIFFQVTEGVAIPDKPAARRDVPSTKPR